MSDIYSTYPPINAPIHGSAKRDLSFDEVVERLVEAWGFLGRLPDRERGWLREPQASTIYSRGIETKEDRWARFGWIAGVWAEEERPTPPGLRSVEVDRMWEALGWVEWVEARDRKLVGLVLASMADPNGPAQTPWRSIAHRLGWAGHPDTLAKRWSRAVTRIAQRLARGATTGEDGGKLCLGAVNPSNALGVK